MAAILEFIPVRDVPYSLRRDSEQRAFVNGRYVGRLYKADVITSYQQAGALRTNVHRGKRWIGECAVQGCLYRVSGRTRRAVVESIEHHHREMARVGALDHGWRFK